MDIENVYFMARFQNMKDYEKVLTEGPCIIFRQYLTIQPWTTSFNPTQPYSSTIISQIKLSGLPGYMYKRNILLEIGETVGKVAKMDMNTDNKTRGHFACMALYVNLDRPLVSQILINGKIQQVVYEFLPFICFRCGRYGHVKTLAQKRLKEQLQNSKLQSRLHHHKHKDDH